MIVIIARLLRYGMPRSLRVFGANFFVSHVNRLTAKLEFPKGHERTHHEHEEMQGRAYLKKIYI